MAVRQRNDSHLAHCLRCKQPINKVPKRDGARLCGQCRAEVYDAAGKAAVADWLTIARVVAE